MEQQSFPPSRILVVDDEAVMRATLEEFLSGAGFQVATAANGQAALTELQRKPVDLMLLDLRMDGLDGVQVIEAGKQIAPDTVIVMLTAHGTMESAITAMRRGAFDYLLKPCQMPEILEAVQRGLAHRSQSLRQRDLVNLMQ